jgi:hypothetical protein
MTRKDFLKKSILGSSILASSVAFGHLLKTKYDPKKVRDIIGFNHLPIKNSRIMNHMIIHKADSRGHANHGWLNSFHSFSFASYYNPEKMNFGALRVLNDDTVSAGMGFGMHPHQNMEIISIPLEGDLEHKDSMGNVQVIRKGDIQVMSAGTGIHHSEYNRNQDRLTKFLQIWVIPNKENVSPRYDQISLNEQDRNNQLQQILSPNPDDEGVWIHQDAWFHMGRFDKDRSTSYQIKKSGNGLYAFVLKGSFTFENQLLETRDALGVWDVTSIHFSAKEDSSEILLIEVPMNL